MVPSRLEVGQTATGKGFTSAYWLYTLTGALFAAGLTNFELISYHRSHAAEIEPYWIPLLLAISTGVGVPAGLLLGRHYDAYGMPRCSSAASEARIGVALIGVSSVIQGNIPRTREGSPVEKKYLVNLTAVERETCRETIKKLKGTSQKVRRAQMLLKADADGPAWTDRRIAEAFDCRTQTIENLRQWFVEQGFEQALERKKSLHPPANKRLDGAQEAKVLAMRLGSPPKGYGTWTLRLLARRVVELELVEAISHETIRQTLKKTA